MGGLRKLSGLMLAVTLGAVGCSLTESQVKPPTPPEEYRSVPAEERYAGPIQYPKSAMDEDVLLKKAAAKGTGSPTGMRGMGGGRPGGGFGQ